MKDQECNDKQTQKSQFASGEGQKQTKEVEAEGFQSGSEGCADKDATEQKEVAKSPKGLEAASNQSCNSAEGADPSACQKSSKKDEELKNGYSPAEGRMGQKSDHTEKREEPEKRTLTSEDDSEEPHFHE